MTPTNWPNPERPGEPMFPERDGWHMLNCASPSRNTIFRFWFSRENVWHPVGQRNLFHTPSLGVCWVAPDMYKNDRYIGPVLTPTQINEMLAAERERCAKACEAGRLPDFSMPEQWHNNGCNHCAHDIRNLGAAP